MQIQVTQDDIDFGMRDVATECAIARAVREKINYTKSVYVGSNYVKIDSQWYNIPIEVIRFIQAFDQGDNYLGDELEPFTFELKV
jgi:hypothetical protein